MSVIEKISVTFLWEVYLFSFIYRSHILLGGHLNRGRTTYFDLFCVAVAGWDHQSQGGQVWTIPLGGMCERQPAAIGGSGAGILYGMLDHRYREKMPREECEELVLHMVTMSIRRDASCGGCCRLAIITKVRLLKSQLCSSWYNVCNAQDGVERKLFLNGELPTRDAPGNW